MESKGILIPTGLEKVFHSTQSTVEANSYRTRGQPIEVTANGRKGSWHSLKGGLTRTTEHKDLQRSLSYEVLFNPESKEWLKMVPPIAHRLDIYGRMADRLKTSAAHERTALEIAGLPRLVDKVEDCELDVKGQETYGFISPHIGPSLEYIIYGLTGEKKPRELPEEAKGFFSQVYSIACDQAERLYLHHGIWMADPNPGNILLHEGDRGVHVVLIDFSNSDQVKENTFDHIPASRFSPDEYSRVIRSILGNRLSRLHDLFRQHCRERGVPFERTPEEVEGNLKTSPAMLQFAA